MKICWKLQERTETLTFINCIIQKFGSSANFNSSNSIKFKNAKMVWNVAIHNLEIELLDYVGL